MDYVMSMVGEVSKALNYSHHLQQTTEFCLHIFFNAMEQQTQVYKVWHHMFKLRIKYMHTLLSHLESSVRHKHFL